MIRNKLTLSAILLASALGAQAQTVETDYPLVTVDGQVAVQVATQRAASQAEPFLIQSNAGPVQVNPVYEWSSTVSRDEVRAGAEIRLPANAGHNA